MSACNLLYCIFFLFFMLFFSCNSYLADGMRVAWGKQLFQQGNYQEALLYFLDAEQNRLRSFQLQPGNSAEFLALRRIQYNVGLIYSALGQSLPAINYWQAILDKGGIIDDQPLQFALLYNIGLLYSQTSQNAKARLNLVQALTLQPDHEGARKALELCLEQLKQSQLSEKLATKENKLQEVLPSESSISDEQILNYISRQANYRFKRDTKIQQALRNDW